jgi:catechol 2,3-dioxygenase-like lactoylglutathione lyase family enzyme
MLSFKRIDHIHLCIPPAKLHEALVFYTEVMGLTEIYRPTVFKAPGHWFDLCGIELHIGVEDTLPRTIRHSAFEVEDVDAARTYLLSKGVEVTGETIIPGRERFSFFRPLWQSLGIATIFGSAIIIFPPTSLQSIFGIH